MSIPSIDALLLPGLKLAADGAEHPAVEIRERLASDFALTRDQLTAKYKNKVPVFSNQVAWAIVHLELAEVVSRTVTGAYQITGRGTSLLSENPTSLTITMLHKMYGVQSKRPPTPTWNLFEDRQRSRT